MRIGDTEYLHFDYARKGHIPTSQGWCNLRVYQHTGKTVVVASEVIKSDGSYANDGMSIINAIEVVIGCVLDSQLKFDVLIEHLPPRGLNRMTGEFDWGEDFSQVEFQLKRGSFAERRVDDVGFHFLTRTEVETLIGEPFAPIPQG